MRSTERLGPLKALSRILDLLYRAAMALALVGIVLIAGVVSWQVFSRYVTSNSASWGPELAQLIFVWTALLAIAVGVRQGKHMRMDAFGAVKKPVLQHILNTISAAVVVVVSVMLAWYGYDSLAVSFRKTFPALGVSQGWMNLAVPVGFGLASIFAVEVWCRSTFGPKPVLPEPKAKENTSAANTAPRRGSPVVPADSEDMNKGI